jgi:hypothetical protein
VFICEKHIDQHKCSLDSTDNFLAHLSQQKQRIERKLSDIKTNLHRESADIGEFNALFMKEVKKSIETQLTTLINEYSISCEKICEDRFEMKAADLRSLMKEFDNCQYASFYVKLKAHSKEVLKEKYMLIQEEVRNFSKRDFIFPAFLDHMKSTLTQFKDLQQYLKNQILEIISGNIDEEKFVSQIRDMILKDLPINKDTAKVGSKPEMKRRFSVLADYVFSIKEKSGKAQFNDYNRRATKDYKFPDIVGENHALNESLIEKSFSIPDDYRSNSNATKIEKLSEKSMLSDFSFEVDESLSMHPDIKESHRQTHYEMNLMQKFQTSQDGMSNLLDKTLHDLNCDGFFDKNQKPLVNEYLDLFKTSFEDILMDMKNNFNKL